MISIVSLPSIRKLDFPFNAFFSLKADFGTLCHLYQGIEAFAFLNWILRMNSVPYPIPPGSSGSSYFTVIIYFGLLLTYALIGHSRGNAPWRGTVRDTQFTTQGASTSVPMTQQATGNAVSTLV